MVPKWRYFDDRRDSRALCNTAEWPISDCCLVQRNQRAINSDGVCSHRDDPSVSGIRIIRVKRNLNFTADRKGIGYFSRKIKLEFLRVR